MAPLTQAPMAHKTITTWDAIRMAFIIAKSTPGPPKYTRGVFEAFYLIPETPDKICAELECQPGDLLEYRSA